MDSLDKDLIRNNIFILIENSGISDINFANLLGISDKQIKRIKKSEAEFSINNINKAGDFFNKSLSIINSPKVEFEKDFRIKLIKKHRGNPEYIKLLSDRPSITYAIKHVLIFNEEFSKKGLTVREINDIFKLNGWTFSSAYISLALKRNKQLFNIIPNLLSKALFFTQKKRQANLAYQLRVIFLL